MSDGLIFLLGDQHRRQRKMLNPVFSTKHMRGLAPVFNPIAVQVCHTNWSWWLFLRIYEHFLHWQLRDKLLAKVRNGEEVVDVVKWLSLAALEYLAQGGLGHSFDSFDETKPNTYSDAAKMLV